jgi:hypothetical protein
MSENKIMSELEIAVKLKAGKRFEVGSIREQKKALTGAKFLGVEITTERIDPHDERFVVKFINSK